jgi:hypothetical protein
MGHPHEVWARGPAWHREDRALRLSGRPRHGDPLDARAKFSAGEDCKPATLPNCGEQGVKVLFDVPGSPIPVWIPQSPFERRWA